MKKVVVFLADGFEEVEGLTVVDLLRRAGAVVETVSELFEKAFFDDAELLVLPGGMPGTLHLKAHKGLADLLCEFNENGREIAAICAAPTVLGALGLLKEKAACCYPGMEEQLNCKEAKFCSFVTDGNITTSRGVGTAIPFALELIRFLAMRKLLK